MNNTDNVYSDLSTNIWNSMEKITYTYNGSTHTNYLGNYWDDYKEKYPYAGEIDSTGIWIQPYTIDSNTDYYPLIEQWENYNMSTELTVHNTDTGKSYSAIQAAIDDYDTKAGHTITVDSGTYNENVVLHKALSLIGNGLPTVDGKKRGDVIRITAGNCVVRGFRCINSAGPWTGGIKIESDYNVVEDNSCEYNNDGITILWSSNNVILNNTCNGNQYGGFSSWDSSNTTISGNTYKNNSYGINLDEHSSNNQLVNNTLINNSYGMIFYSDSSNNTITGNTARNNDYGIRLESSSNNTISGNNASDNNYGIDLWDSSNNKIYLNNFLNSDNVVSRNSTNIWNSAEKITYIYNSRQYTNYLGNYWSDYVFEGNDTNGYGIGDTPYSIYGDNDSYPLMVSWENYFAPTENIFDTGPSENPYPCISGTHNGIITLNQTITVQTLYTYPCAGTGGHTEYAKIYNDTWRIESVQWAGYREDWHNLTFPKPFKLHANEEYNYTLRTSSYPQIHHTNNLSTPTGFITCSEFTDANGKRYTDRMPAIKLCL